VVGLDNGATSNYATVLDAAGRFLVDRLVETPSSARPRLSTRRVVTGRCRPSSHDPAGGKALERATGVLMERHSLPADTAAERIRQTAARQGITMSEAAARLLRQPPAEGRHRSGR
jgi:AmiR/NasT family two-component response regulator